MNDGRIVFEASGWGEDCGAEIPDLQTALNRYRNILEGLGESLATNRSMAAPTLTDLASTVLEDCCHQCASGLVKHFAPYTGLKLERGLPPTHPDNLSVMIVSLGAAAHMYAVSAHCEAARRAKEAVTGWTHVC